MKQGIAYFVVIAVLGNIIAALWLMWWTTRTRARSPRRTHSRLDDDLTEYNNPCALVVWMFFLSIVFGLGYLVLFPGSATTRGSCTGRRCRSSTRKTARRARPSSSASPDTRTRV